MSYELGRREVCFEPLTICQCKVCFGWVVEGEGEVEMPPPVALPSPPLVVIGQRTAGPPGVHPPGVSPSLCRALGFTPALYVSVAFVSIMASPAELQQTIIAFVKKGLYADALARTNERTWP